MLHRGVVGRPAPGPFHCLGCKVYVHGTESGHCPRCGFVPPEALAIVGEHPRFDWSAIALVATVIAAIIAFVR